MHLSLLNNVTVMFLGGKTMSFNSDGSDDVYLRCCLSIILSFKCDSRWCVMKAPDFKCLYIFENMSISRLFLLIETYRFWRYFFYLVWSSVLFFQLNFLLTRQWICATLQEYMEEMLNLHHFYVLRSKCYKFSLRKTSLLSL